MALIFNNTNIAPSYTVRYNNTALKAVKYGSTQVWSSTLPLYTNGTQNVAWVTDWSNRGTVSWGSSAVVLSASDTGGYDRGVSIRTAGTIPFTDYSRLYVVGGHAYHSGTVPNRTLISVTDTPGLRQGMGQPEAKWLYQWTNTTALSNYTWAIDISGISGSHYLVIAAENGMTYQTPNATITQIYLQ